jgi:hypothetical protein
MKHLLIPILCCLCTLPMQGQNEKPRIVVSYITNDKVEDDFRGVFTDALSVGLQNSQMYEVYDLRSEFAAIQKKELDYQTEGHVRDDELLDAARVNGIQFAAYITIRAVNDQYSISVRFNDLQTGKAVGAPFTVRFPRSDPFSAADEVTSRLVRMRSVTAVQKKSFITCECAIDEYGKRVKSDVSASNESPLTHAEAIEFCKNKGEGFRLPTRTELLNIFYTPELAPFVTKDYWTADSRNSYEAYIINFGALRTDIYYSKNIRNTFRCIRD